MAEESDKAHQRPDGDHPCTSKPWHCGAEPHEQQQAWALYSDGNASLENGLFKIAAQKYRKALKHWSHPTIHYFLMISLMNLEQHLDAYKHSVEAIRYGPDALPPGDYDHALKYHQHLSAHVSTLAIACDEPGAIITLNGKRLFTAPGRVELLVEAQEHELVARKPGYMVTSKALTLKPGGQTSVRLRLLSADQHKVDWRPMPSWKPWSVVAAGAGTALIGSAMQWRASVLNQRYQRALLEDCPDGCDEMEKSTRIRDLESGEPRYRNLSYVAYSIAGIGAISGAVLLYINRGRTRLNPELDHRVEVSIVPTISMSHQGVAARLRF